MYSKLQKRTVNNLSLQCCELDENDNKFFRKKETQNYENVTYDKRLIKGEHDDKLDRQEFSQRASSFKFFMCEAIEHDKSIESKAR